MKASKEYLDFKKAKEELNQNPELKEKEQDKQKVEKMKKIYLELIKEEKVKNYFDVELKFNVLLADVNKIIGEAVQDVLK